MKGVLACIAIAVVACLMVASVWPYHPREAAMAWLVAWAWCFTIAAGALGLDLLLEACDASWQVVLRPALDAMQAVVAPLAVLFIPIALSAHLLYPWASTGPPPGVRALLEQRHALQDLTAWCVRSAAYLAVLIGIVACLRHAPQHRRKQVACAALPAYAIALTGASWDWFMSLDVRFASAVYGAWVWASGVRAACGVWVVLALLGQQAERRLLFRNDHLVALGQAPARLHAGRRLHGFPASSWCRGWPTSPPRPAGISRAWLARGERSERRWASAGTDCQFLALLSLGAQAGERLRSRWWGCGSPAGTTPTWHGGWCRPGRQAASPAAWAFLDLAASGVAIAAASLAWALASLRCARTPAPGPRLRASIAYRVEIAA